MSASVTVGAEAKLRGRKRYLRLSVAATSLGLALTALASGPLGPGWLRDACFTAAALVLALNGGLLRRCARVRQELRALVPGLAAALSDGRALQVALSCCVGPGTVPDREILAAITAAAARAGSLSVSALPQAETRVLVRCVVSGVASQSLAVSEYAPLLMTSSARAYLRCISRGCCLACRSRGARAAARSLFEEGTIIGLRRGESGKLLRPQR